MVATDREMPENEANVLFEPQIIEKSVIREE